MRGGSIRAPLLPDQMRFLERDLPERDHWNIPAIVSLDREIPTTVLADGFSAVVARHEGLHLHLVDDGESGCAGFNPLDGGAVVDDVDLCASADPAAAIEERADGVHRSFSLAEAPLWRLVRFDLGPARAARLLVVFHHFIVDGTSLRLVMRDFELAVQQLLAGEAVAFARPTGSVSEWAGLLADAANDEVFHQQLPFWEEHLRDVQPFPRDHDGENTMASAQTRIDMLDRAETMHFRETLRREGVTVNQAVAAAVSVAIRPRLDGPFAYNVFGHGRRGVQAGRQIAQTVGWLSCRFPLTVGLDTTSAVADTLAALRERWSCVPSGGIGYGLLRYLARDEGARHALRQHPEPEIGFNFLGTFGETKGRLFGSASEPTGTDETRVGLRDLPVRVDVFYTDRRLALMWFFSTALHDERTIADWSSATLGALRAWSAER